MPERLPNDSTARVLLSYLGKRPLAAHAVAAGFVALATLWRLAVGPIAGETLPFITFFPAVVGGAYVAGWSGGVLAIALSALSAWYLFLAHAPGAVLPPRAQLLGLAFFCVSTLLAVAFTVALRRANEKLKASEERLSLLLDELSHRVKNMLASLQAIAGATARSVSSVEEFERALMGRIGAMAQAHELLSDRRWQGAPLRDIVRRELGSFEDGNHRRFTIDGPAIDLPPEFAVPFSMAVYELATNAAKYGALSVPEGRVLVRWDLRVNNGERSLRFEWRESNGPAVASPEQQGFGTRLLRRLFAGELGAEPTITFAREGLSFAAEVPLLEKQGSADDLK